MCFLLLQRSQIGEVIGSGGFGKVYGARWNGTDVALKVVHHNRSLSEESVEKLMKEAEVVAIIFLFCDFPFPSQSTGVSLLSHRDFLPWDVGRARICCCSFFIFDPSMFPRWP